MGIATIKFPYIWVSIGLEEFDPASLWAFIDWDTVAANSGKDEWLSFPQQMIKLDTK